MHIQYRVDQHSLTFSRDALGGYVDSLQFIAVVYRDDGLSANSIQSNEQIQISADGLAGALNSGIIYDQTIAIPVSGISIAPTPAAQSRDYKHRRPS